MAITLNLEVISISPKQHVPNARGGYDVIEVAYRKDGKIEGKKVMSFVNPKVFEALGNFSAGDNISVTAEKVAGRDGKEYWQWTAVESGSEQPSQASSKPVSALERSASVATKSVSNYETKEERAARQVMIVRQSSLSNAVATLAVGAKKLEGASVVALAKEYEAFVLGTETVAKYSDNIADMDDDLID